MSSAVRTAKLRTESEMQAYLRERAPGLKIYNPSEEWLRLDVHGRTDLIMPPDLDGAVEPHPITSKPVACDGTLEIRSRYLNQRDSSGELISGQDAESTVRFVCHQERYGQMGVVWLTGVPEEDAEQKRAAKEQYAAFRVKQDEAIVAARAEFVQNWAKAPQRQGQKCPAPTEAESAAMERLQEIRARKTFKFECDAENCPGYAVNDWVKFARHMDVAHGIKVRREQYESVAGEAAEAQPVKRGRKPKEA